MQFSPIREYTTFLLNLSFISIQFSLYPNLHVMYYRNRHILIHMFFGYPFIVTLKHVIFILFLYQFN